MSVGDILTQNHAIFLWHAELTWLYHDEKSFDNNFKIQFNLHFRDDAPRYVDGLTGDSMSFR